MAMNRSFLFGSWFGRLALVFVIFCVIQFTLVAHLRPNVARTSPAWRSRVHQILHTKVYSNAAKNEKENERDFGVMARKVAQMTHLAEEQVSAVGEDPALFNKALTKLFPWWHSSKIMYYPWQPEVERRKHEARSSDDKNKVGIVIGVGNNNVYTAAVLIASLRQVLNSTIPIELAYVGEEDLLPKWREYLYGLAGNKDIYPLDLAKIFDPKLVGLHTWDTKPFSIIGSRFQQTILMDADATFFIKPDDAFESHPSLKEHGTLFFHDRAKFWWDPLRHNVDERLDWLAKQIQGAGRHPSAFLNISSMIWAGNFLSEEMDSCVVFFDKSRPRQYISMLFTAWMNAESGGRPEIYTFFHGDKETYWLAGELTGTPFHFDPWSAARFAKSDPELDYSAINHTTQLPSCTEHIVHPVWDGSEPWLANEGIMLDKNNPDSDFANWTHWYLGEPIKEALAIARNQNSLPSDASHLTPMQDEVKKDFERRILLNQPDWSDHCQQEMPENWKPLSRTFRQNLWDMIDVAKGVQTQYREMKQAEEAEMKKAEEAETIKAEGEAENKTTTDTKTDGGGGGGSDIGSAKKDEHDNKKTEDERDDKSDPTKKKAKDPTQDEFDERESAVKALAMQYDDGGNEENKLGWGHQRW